MMERPARRIMDDLRRARVLVIHPRDEDGQTLVTHLNRLGCTVETAWTAPDRISAEIDTVLVEIGDATVERLRPVIDQTSAAVIAIMTYESPTALKAIIDLNVHGVISKPLRPLGILTQFVLARHRRGFEQRLSGKVSKLEDTLKSRRLVDKAIRILATSRNLDDERAYKLLHDHATAKRVPLATVAASVISAHETMNSLGLGGSPGL